MASIGRTVSSTRHFAEQTGAEGDDLAIFWKALEMMWDVDRSSSRGEMACRGLYVFSHESKLGNAAAHRLFELVCTPPSASTATRAPSRTTPSSGRTTDRLRAFPGVTLTTLVG